MPEAESKSENDESLQFFCRPCKLLFIDADGLAGRILGGGGATLTVFKVLTTGSVPDIFKIFFLERRAADEALVELLIKVCILKKQDLPINRSV